MTKFAEGTTVSPEKSQMEIQTLLRQRGATQYGVTIGATKAMVMFELDGRKIAFKLDLPDDPKPFFRTPAGKLRTGKQATAQMQAEIRRLWRALLLVIKAKFEAIDSGILTAEEAFLAHTLLPTGETVHEWSAPIIQKVYREGALALPDGITS